MPSEGSSLVFFTEREDCRGASEGLFFCSEEIGAGEAGNCALCLLVSDGFPSFFEVSIGPSFAFFTDNEEDLGAREGRSCCDDTGALGFLPPALSGGDFVPFCTLRESLLRNEISRPSLSL